MFSQYRFRDLVGGGVKHLEWKEFLKGIFKPFVLLLIFYPSVNTLVYMSVCINEVSFGMPPWMYLNVCTRINIGIKLRGCPVIFFLPLHVLIFIKFTLTFFLVSNREKRASTLFFLHCHTIPSFLRLISTFWGACGP